MIAPEIHENMSDQEIEKLMAVPSPDPLDENALKSFNEIVLPCWSFPVKSGALSPCFNNVMSISL